eukprot:6834499-Prymnesium_polylepis.1
MTCCPRKQKRRDIGVSVLQIQFGFALFPPSKSVENSCTDEKMVDTVPCGGALPCSLQRPRPRDATADSDTRVSRRACTLSPRRGSTHGTSHDGRDRESGDTITTRRNSKWTGTRSVPNQIRRSRAPGGRAYTCNYGGRAYTCNYGGVPGDVLQRGRMASAALSDF